AAVVVTVQQKFGAVCRQYGAKFCTVAQPPEIALQRADWRMMDQHDAEIFAGLLERFGQSAELPLAEAARRHEWAGRHAGRKRDERNVAAAPDEGKAMEAVVAAHVIAPELRREFFDAADINIMVARQDCNVMGTSDCFEPAPGPRIFAGQREINEI